MIVYLSGSSDYTAIKSLDGNIIGLITSYIGWHHAEIFDEANFFLSCESYLSSVRAIKAELKQRGYHVLSSRRAKKLITMR